MNKYIIKNCPCFYEENEEVNDYTCTWGGTEELACQDCTNCVMKRVIGKCIELYNMECKNPYKTNGYMLAFDILKEMDIQEAE